MTRVIRPLTLETWELFGRAGASNGCWCQYWRAVLEAYPIDTTVAGHSRNTFTGVASTFLAHRVTEVARRRPDRPILRLALR